MTLQSLVREDAVIFDVGAHKGETTSKFLDIFKTPKIFSFEPNPFVYKTLNEKYGKFANCYNFGLSNEDGFKKFYLKNSTATSSLLKSIESNSISYKNHDAFSEFNQRNLQFKKLDTFCLEQKIDSIDSIDLLKMDVQGPEYSVLKGATRLLLNNKIIYIFRNYSFQCI